MAGTLIRDPRQTAPTPSALARLWQFLVAVSATAAALGLTWILPDALHRPFFLFFIAAAGLSAWYGGWIPGLLSVALGSAATAYFFLRPGDQTPFLNSLDQLRLGLFTASAVFIVWLFSALRSTQMALQLHADRFRRAQRSANIAAFDWDIVAGRVTWSEELPALRGLVRGDGTEDWAAFVHEADRARLRAAFEQAIASGAEADTDLRVVRPDGAVHWIAVRGQVFYDPKTGQPVRMLGVAVDITDRKAAESRLEAQHAITRALMGSPSPDTAMCDVLRIVCESLDWDLGQLWLVHQPDERLRRSADWQHDPQLAPFARENAALTFPRAAGIPGRVWDSAQPLWVEDLGAESGSPRGAAFTRLGLCSAFGFPILLDSHVMGVMEFFSRQTRRPDPELLQTAADLGAQIGQFIERRHAQQALRDSEERYRTTLGSIGDAVIATDAQGCVQFINAVAQQLTGWSQPEAARRPLGEVFRLVQGDGHQSVPDPVRRVLEAQGPAALETGAVLVAFDGKQIPIDDSAAPIRNDAGELIGVVLVFRDVRSRRRAEEALRSSEKLAATGRLAASIAHEINNPMEAVTNLLYLIESAPALDETTRQYARMAGQELARMDKIVKQTLGFYRESAQPVPVRLASVLDNVLEIHAGRLQRKHVIVRKRYRFQGEIEAFPGEMRQVFSNLLANALDAVGEDGILCLHINRGHDWSGSHGPGVRVTVADNGAGIAPDHLHRIFEPLFTTKGESGTGLGLWVTYGIVQKHGGHIQVRSHPSGAHRGTSFSVFLPDAFAGAATPVPQNAGSSISDAA